MVYLMYNRRIPATYNIHKARKWSLACMRANRLLDPIRHGVITEPVVIVID
jgi:hypothetical protein